MNVLRSFVRKSLAENRSRTLVTVIGIILSIALLTAVIEGAYSGVVFMRRSEEERVGSFHGFYYHLTADEAEEISQDREIADAVRWQEVGWARLENGNEYKPYLLVESVGENFTDLVSVHLTSGRMPENEHEILLPDHFNENSVQSYAVGNEMNLQLGQRFSADGWELSMFDAYVPEEEEEIVNVQEKTFTVCGTYSRFSRVTEPYSSPGYIALTNGGGTGNFGLFFTVRSPGDFYSYAQAGPKWEECEPHADLLNLYGNLRSSVLSRVLYSFAAILIILIGFGSVSLIYNSFSISVSERTKQFGLLKSVGATRKQIRSCVFYEALILSVIAIPAGLIVGCIGIGLTLYFLRDSFAGFLYGDTQTKMSLVISPAGLLIAALLGLLTTLISAYIPALRAMRVSPIESIRQSSDIRESPRSVKTSGLTYRLFGFEGMLAAKNFRRNRKRYRSVIVSLFLSVVLFISASSFCSYLSDLVGGVTSDVPSADIVYQGNGDEGDPQEFLALLSSAKGVEKSEYEASLPCPLLISADSLTDRALDLYSPQGKQMEFGSTVIFLDDVSFRELLKESGVSADKYFDAGHPRALFQNSFTAGMSEPGEDMTWEKIPVIRENRFPETVYISETREVEGYSLFRYEYDEEGNEFGIYFENEVLREYYSGDMTEEPDESLARRIPMEELRTLTPVTLGDSVSAQTLLSPRSMSCVIYPYSMAAAVLGEEAEENTVRPATQYAFCVRNHREAMQEMTKILTDHSLPDGNLYDLNSSKESQRMLIRVIRVFSYGFIILISLIAASNVFNTISMSVSLRRREFAMLRSIGMHDRAFRRMSAYECIIYGVRALLWGLPAAILVTYAIYSVTGIAYQSSFYVPLDSILIAVASVFLVVSASMIYAVRKIRRDNPIDALKNENL